MSSPLVNQLRRVAEQAAAPMVADVANEVGVCVGLEDGEPVIELRDSGIRLHADDVQWFGIKPKKVDEGDRVLVLSLGPEYLVAGIDADADGAGIDTEELETAFINLVGGGGSGGGNGDGNGGGEGGEGGEEGDGGIASLLGATEVHVGAEAPEPRAAEVIWVDTDETGITPPSLVSALPSSPGDGQEVYYQADATAGVVWHLRYNAFSASAYKWEFLGGSALRHNIDASESFALTSYADLATVGPQVTLPLPGVYAVRLGSHCIATNYADWYGIFGMKLGAAAAVDRMSAQGPGGNASGVGRVQLTPSTEYALTSPVAATVLKMQYYVAGAGPPTVYFSRRWLAVTPVRVG